MNLNSIEKSAHGHGLSLRGQFNTCPSDAIPDRPDGKESHSLLLFGQVGHSVWPAFIESSEYQDKQPNPLDRWSERIGNALARNLDGLLLLPFGDAPHHPFLRWAQRAEPVQPSKLGMLIHPTHGLWHAYRFAIALPIRLAALPAHSPSTSLCDSCKEQPCLSACPVNAFDGHQYNVQACSQYLQINAGAACHTDGCIARNACPKGTLSRYVPEQQQFHLQQFLVSRDQPLDEDNNS